jgi:hypothetical protein
MDQFEFTENTAKKQRGRPFESGKSGNPNGRPKGARNRATVLAEALLDGEAEAVTRKVIDKALAGDMAALRLCLERLSAPRRSRTVNFELPGKIETISEAASASASVLKACAAGDLSPAEASEVMNLLSAHLRLVDLEQLEARVSTLEKAQEK